MRVFLRMGEEIRGGDSVGTQWETRGKTQGYTLNPKARPQKKVLSLVLCVAMLLSVMVMGTGAAFTDQDEIQNAEAVDMTSALGIIDGYEDGSFQPAENIERGEAAKMISAMLNGGRDSVQETTESSYNDVLGSVDAWANKYIEYCTARGIVSGVGGDRFAPASNVTGTQLAKMLLVSLGYDSVKEGYQDNAMWSVNVNTDAVAAGLYAGIETIDMSAPLSRDNAAQMIWNALQAKTVVYLTDSTGAINIQDTTLLEKVYGAHVETGVMSHIDYNYDTKEYTYSIGDFNSYSTGNTVTNVEKYSSTKDFTDLYAMNVTVLVKGDEALMIRVNEGGTVVEGVWGDISATQNDHFNTINVNGEKYRLDNVAKDWKDFESITVAYNNFTTYHDLRDQYSFRAIDIDGGGDIDVIVVYPYVVLKTDYVRTASFHTNIIDRHDANMTVLATAQDTSIMNALGLQNASVNTVEFDDVIVNGTVTNNGYVMAVPAKYTATGIDTYTVLEMATGTVTKAASADKMISLDGTQYDGNLLEQISAFKQISVGKDYGYIQVNGYLFIMDGTGIVPAMTQYAVVTAVADSSSATNHTYQTDLLLTTGETVTWAVNGQKSTVGSMYTYQQQDDGTYTLTAVVNNPAPEDSEFDIQQAYKTGATLSDRIAYDDNGEDSRFDITKTGIPYFENADNANDLFNIEDDAVIFAFIDRDSDNNGTPDTGYTGYQIDARSSEYVVLSGADLKNMDPSDVYWAFTGATEKDGDVATVDLGYVRLTVDPRDSGVFAYVVSDADRTYDDGHYIHVGAKIDATGTVYDYTTAKSIIQNSKLYQDLYATLEEGGVFCLLLDNDGNLVGVVDEYTQTGTITQMTGSVIKLNNAVTSYYNTEDTVVINAGDANDTLQIGDSIIYLTNSDNEFTLIVYGIDAYVPGTVALEDGLDSICTATVDRSGNIVTVTLTHNTSNFSSDLPLTVTYDVGNSVTVPGVRSGNTITYTFTAASNIAALTISR